MTSVWIFALLCLILSLQHWIMEAHAGTDIAKSTGAQISIAPGLGKDAREAYERDVDEVALAAQNKAVSRLSTLLGKYVNTYQEPVLLAKLAELQQQNAAILFRIAHGLAHSSGKALDITRYNRAMKASVKTLSTLIAKYPKFEEIHTAYFMRGQAFEELKDVKAAIEDYTFLVNHFPNAEEAASSYMSLAQFAIEANDHPRAIKFLKEVEKQPEDPHYPFALYKLAWSSYNLKDIPAALSYAERQVDYYNQRKKAVKDAGEGDLATSDEALRENTLLDCTTFFLDGFESGKSQYELSEALPYFRKLEKGAVLGRMLVRYAKLLRAHGHDDELMKWKDQIIEEESSRPEAMDVVLVTYEHQLNKRRYPQLVASAQDMVKLYPNLKGENGRETLTRAQKILLDTADGLQTSIIKNKDATEVRSLSTTLAAIYDAFTKIVDESDPRIPRVHYNLAETLFTIKDYHGATTHYRWVVDHGHWGDKMPLARPVAQASAKPGTQEITARKEAAATVADASLKAIAARYETLRQDKRIPAELTARPESDDQERKLAPELAEWITWIDAHVDRSVDHGFGGADTFVFEANRVLYDQRHLHEAVKRLREFAFKHSGSSYAIPSASLVIDTYIAGKEWEKTHDLATDLMDVKEWKNSDFGKRLFAVAADAMYKQIEVLYGQHDYRATVKRADDFLKKYATSARLPETLALAGNAALTLGEKDRALAYFSRLIQDAPKARDAGGALVSRASLEEDRYQFGAAANDYRAYLSLPAGGREPASDSALAGVRRKTLMLSWLSGDAEKLKAALDSKSVCAPGLSGIQDECEKYRILTNLAAAATTPPSEEATLDAFDRARKMSEKNPNRALWAALALEGANPLPFPDRNVAARIAASGWDDLDPIVKFTLVPTLSRTLPQAFRLNRAAMKEVAPLRADEKYITRRVEVIHEMENAAEKVLALPWAKIRAEVLNELASLYLDLSKDLSTLPPPKNLSTEDFAAYDQVIHKLILPFDERGQDMREKAFEIASRSAIEDDAYNGIAQPFFAENPTQAKALKPLVAVDAPAAVDLGLLARLDSSGGWKAPKSDQPLPKPPGPGDDPAPYLKKLWMRAIQEKRWPQIAFFMQEAQEKALVQAGVMGVVKAVSLATAGARGEALSELEESRKDLAPGPRNLVLTTLVQYSLRACARERTAALLKDIQPENLSKEQEQLVAHASSYAAIDPRTKK